MQAPDSALVSPGSLDSGKYDPIEHLNAIFSHPSTLPSVTTASIALKDHQAQLDGEIADLVKRQAKSDLESVDSIRAARNDLAELFGKIENVRGRASQTEQAITEMTAEIKRLDGTKRNLTMSMTALKRLQMLTTAYEQLRSLSRTRQYEDCAQLLQAVIQLMAYFKSYRSIDQIAALGRNVADLQIELLEQVCEDFEITFAKGETAQRRGTLADACLVMDALGENARLRLITWFCNTQLREYRQVFRANDEAASLDNISRRYSWFKRTLKTYDEEHAALFPPSWRVDESLIGAFCESTRDDFKAILSRHMRRVDGQKLDVDLLVSCLQMTLDFEHSLEKRFAHEASQPFMWKRCLLTLVETLSSRDDKPSASGRAISEAFEPYLSLWVEAQDRQLSSMISQYRQQPARTTDEEFNPQSVVPSSVELFHFYRTTLAQCAKLSSGSSLVELSRAFAEHLDEYAEQILLNYLRISAGNASSAMEDIILTLNTAEYCHTTCGQLDEKIKNRVDEDLRTKIDLQSQQDAFMGVASAAVRGLVRLVELDCETSWREMRNHPWSKLENVVDQSPYVASLLRHIKARSDEILHLFSKQQYARAFGDNLVEAVVNTFLLNLVQCKPISETAAEQMLLDLYSLKKEFEDLLTPVADPSSGLTASHRKRIHQSMTKLDPLLKTLQVRPSPAEGLVQAYLVHIGDRSDANFKKVLELKGIRKPEQAQLLQLMHAHRASLEHLLDSSPLLAPLNLQYSSVGSGMHTSTPMSAISASALPNRFDPATLGSALMTAARDGVDRLGTPTPGAGMAATPVGASSPSPMVDGHAPPANLNENLRNIGRFFKRDMGGFSGRFTSNKTSEDAR